MLLAKPMLFLAVLSAAAGSSCSSSKFESGCSHLASTKNVTTVRYMCAQRTILGLTAAHCGLEWETEDGKFSLAYNSQTIPGPVSTPGCLWCQSGGMPMKNVNANGDCTQGSPGCGSWLTAGSAGGHADVVTGQFGTAAAFIAEVKKYASDHRTYNLGACEAGGGGKTNCQSATTYLYQKTTGQKPHKCSTCDPNCF